MRSCLLLLANSVHRVAAKRCSRKLSASPVGVHERSLSLLVSNLSSISSKASVGMRTPPENGYSITPIVNSARAITAASAKTISLCAQAFPRPEGIPVTPRRAVYMRRPATLFCR